MKKRILLIRTHKHLNAGGPIPPLGLLYIATAILKNFADTYELKIINLGLNNLTVDDIICQIKSFDPYIVGMSVLTCEADIMHEIAKQVKATKKEIIVLVGGPHATLMKEGILHDYNIDYGVIGEGENTIIELLHGLENSREIPDIKGIAYRSNKSIFCTQGAEHIADLDSLSILPDAWELIDLKEYTRCANWNGAGREKLYAPILTSRGCPFNCAFCNSRNIFGRGFRTRSPENVFSEILFLYRKYGVKEIHIIDDVFNFNSERVSRICSLIVNSGIDFSLAFPNGLRIDMMTEEMISSLKRAGTYKINYGIETAEPDMQRIINKELNLTCANDIINKTMNAGIITAGYFILGFPNESRENMMKTVRFALESNLDNAYFFKYTNFLDGGISEKKGKDEEKISHGHNDLHFYSLARSGVNMPEAELNNIILKAQQDFYLNPRRILRGILRAKHKLIYLRNLLNAFSLILQSYLFRELIFK
ncbi:MAG: radical SAM protein [Candidatus Omnitrophica bacterium]|jgi:radical SAM superfamily enzyme YgiQ (UPF0313 family)|nr:radical SAM protein [Candidatus Omnitrophota bacterium]